MVGLSQVLGASQHLQVGGNMKPAHNATSDRHYVIHVVPRAGFFSQACGFFVETSKHFLRGPLWATSAFRHLSRHDVGNDLRVVFPSPFFIRTARMFRVGLTPRLPLLPSALSVLRVPLSVGVWVFFSPLVGLGIDARLALIRQSVLGSLACVEVCKRLFVSTNTAKFYVISSVSRISGAWFSAQGVLPIIQPRLERICL